MAKYKPWDTVYFIENNYKVQEATVKVFSGGFYTLIFGNSAIRLRESRLYATLEEAENNCPAILREKKREEEERVRLFCNH